MSENREVRIVVGHRGWVHVGYYHVERDEIVLERARCIRNWGTRDRGLNHLVNGPTDETVLDDPGTVRMHRLAVVHTVDCDSAKWSGALK